MGQVLNFNIVRNWRYYQNRKESTLPGRHTRIAREAKTVEAMIRMRCSDQHRAREGLCPECEVLLQYTRQRLAACPYQAQKTTCAKCPIHCYKPTMRKKIRAVMRYAGPRIMYRHPLLALYHLIEGIRKEPLNHVR